MPLSRVQASRPERAVSPAPQTHPATSRRRGATALEYVFVASLIIVVAFSAINYLGQQTKASLEQSNNTIQQAENPSNP